MTELKLLIIINYYNSEIITGTRLVQYSRESRSKMAEPKVELFLDVKSVLGETPIYDHRSNEIIWVDIDGMSINILNVATRNNRVIQFNDFVGAAIPCASGVNLLAVSKQNIILINKTTGIQRKIATATNDKTNRFNDAQCDRQGRMWSGTITIVEGVPGTFLQEQGMLFSFDGDSIKCHKSNLSISNGIAWSTDWKKMYLVDSIPQCVYSFDYDECTGSITNQQTIINMADNYRTPLPAAKSVDLKNDRDHVIPDGMCIDSEGKLWIAEHNGRCVSRWDPDSGKLLKQIPIPARKTTACCFGGPNYDTLFVTTGSVYNSANDWDTYPNSGSIFAITNLGIKGLPAQFFDDSKFLNY